MTSLFNIQPQLVRVEFPDGLTRVYTAGDLVRGTVQLTLASGEGKKGQQRQLKIASVIAKLRVQQTSSYYRRKGASKNNREGRTEEVRLYSKDKTLWDARYQALPDSNPLPPTIFLPFEFRLPPFQLGLPPSFEGGTRGGSPLGHQVGRITYFVKITAKKSTFLSIDERTVLPFIYMPPSLVQPHHIPPPLTRNISERGTLDPVPPPLPSYQGFSTTMTEKDFKESWFGKKSRVVVKFTLPSLPSLPRNTPIPYHLSLILFAPPSFTSSTSQLNLPSPSSLELTLVRDVFTKVRTESQVIPQVIGPLVDLKNEKRVWYLPHGWRVDHGQNRWAAEVVVAGEFVIGGAAGPSFGVGSTKGMLGCEYHVRLKLPLPRSSTLLVDPFLPLSITSNVHYPYEKHSKSDAGPSLQTTYVQLDLPPSYLEVDAKVGAPNQKTSGEKAGGKQRYVHRGDEHGEGGSGGGDNKRMAEGVV